MYSSCMYGMCVLMTYSDCVVRSHYDAMRRPFCTPRSKYCCDAFQIVLSLAVCPPRSRHLAFIAGQHIQRLPDDSMTHLRQ